MFLQDSLFRDKIVPYLCAFFIVFSVILLVVLVAHDNKTHCYEVCLTYEDGTIEVVHCSYVHQRDDYLLIDFERKIIYTSLREYTYKWVYCDCTG